MKRNVSRKTGAIVLFLLIGYVSISYFVGFPLGFGKILSQHAAKSYCSKIYPEAQVGKTVFNPVRNGYQTTVTLGDERIYVSANPAKDFVYDAHREELFLNESGIAEIIAELTRTNGHFYACRVIWNCDDTITPIVSLRIDYTDDESVPLPSQAQIKELLAPVALEFIARVENIHPLESIEVQYYHPDFNPDEKGYTWRSMTVALNNNTPRTKEIFYAAELVEK